MTKFSKKIRKAIFPVGGLGTRFLPATKSIPKEMLPVLEKPLVQYAVDEALEAGISVSKPGNTANDVAEKFWEILDKYKIKKG